MSGAPTEVPYELRTTSTVRRALSETLPEAVAAATYEFITGPLLADDKDRVVIVVDVLRERIDGRIGRAVKHEMQADFRICHPGMP